MANSTEREPGRFRMAMDNGELVEVDGSTLVDEDTGRSVLAVILRLPPWRAHALAHVLASWNTGGGAVRGRAAGEHGRERSGMGAVRGVERGG
jgi:hypothetical protein